MTYERMNDKMKTPTDDEIENNIGEKSVLWSELHKYLDEYYDFTPELVYYGKKYGWTLRYRKSGKTLCSLFPEKDAFTVLIVLGKKEVEKTYTIIDELSSGVRKLFDSTEQLRDGRWLWIRVLTNNDLESIKLILKVKRKPKNKNCQSDF